MRLYAKYYLVAIIFGVLQVLYYFRVGNKMLFSELIFISSFYKPDFFMPVAIDMFLDYIPFFIMQILFGTYLYRHFCSGSIYYFSRCKSRVRWFLEEAVKLYGYIILYILAMLLSRIIFCELSFGINYNPGSLNLFIDFFVIYSLWLFITTLLINLIAIGIGSQNSVVIMSGIQGILIFLIQIFDKLLPFDHNPNLYGKLLQINPMSHLVMSWHSSKIDMVNNIGNVLGISFPFSKTILYFGMSSIILIFIGGMIIKRTQFIVVNKETGGV